MVRPRLSTRVSADLPYLRHHDATRWNLGNRAFDSVHHLVICLIRFRSTFRHSGGSRLATKSACHLRDDQRQHIPNLVARPWFCRFEADGTQEQFERIYGWGVAANSIGVAVALLIGGWLAESDFLLPLLLSVITPWAAAAIAATGLKEPPRTTGAEAESFFGTLMAGMHEARSNRSVGLIIGMFAMLPMAYGVLEEYIGPMLHERETFSMTEIGAVAAFALVARTLGLSVAHRFRAPTTRRLAALFMRRLLRLQEWAWKHLEYCSIFFSARSPNSLTGKSPSRQPAS